MQRNDLRLVPELPTNVEERNDDLDDIGVEESRQVKAGSEDRITIQETNTRHPYKSNPRAVRLEISVVLKAIGRRISRCLRQKPCGGSDNGQPYNHRFTYRQYPSIEPLNTTGAMETDVRHAHEHEIHDT